MKSKEIPRSYLSLFSRFGHPTFIPENPFVYSEEPHPITDSINLGDDHRHHHDLLSSLFHGTNHLPIFGLRKQNNHSYHRITFEESLKNSSSKEIIFVINYTPSKNNTTNENEFICPWHLRNVLAYFSLKGIGYESEEKPGKVVQIILLSPTLDTCFSFFPSIFYLLILI